MVKRGITGELSMTLEDNFMINRFLEAIGARSLQDVSNLPQTVTLLTTTAK